MRTFQYTINDPIGLHARPAGMLVKEAKEFSSKIVLECGEKSADARKLIALMALGAKCGSMVTVCVEGTDEEAAEAAMRTFFENNL